MPVVLVPEAWPAWIGDGSLFFTLPTRGLTGQQIMPSEG
jgi:hypothetical protein